MMLRLLLAMTLLPTFCFSQKPNKYWIEFTDKSDTPYSVFHPEEFLSARAIDRRAKAGIAVD